MSSTPFDPTIYPPKPILHVRFGLPGRSLQTETLPALVDTGADFTLVPTRYLSSINPPESRQARARGLFGKFQIVSLYSVDLHLEIGTLVAIEVIGVDDSVAFDSSEIVLGRNVLNRLHLFFDGPELQTYLLERKPLQF